MADESRRIDDPDVYLQIKDWAAAEIDEGRSPESCAEELLGNGWHPDDVEGVVEEARRYASDGRGGRSAARSASAGFSAPNFQTVRTTGPSGCFNPIMGLIQSLISLFGSRKKK